MFIQQTSERIITKSVMKSLQKRNSSLNGREILPF